MDASIICLVYNRPEVLRWQLRSIKDQKGSCSFEVIVLNDGLPNPTIDTIVEQFKDSLNIQYYFTGKRNNPNKMIWRHWGWLFNIGAQKAQGEKLIGACDSILLNDLCIDKIVNEAKNTDIVYASNYIHDDHRSKEECNNIRIYDKFCEIDGYLPFEEVIKLNLTEYCINTIGVSGFYLWSIDRKYFISIGGCDEDFTGRGYDDNDLTNRLLADNKKASIIECPAVHLWHKRDDSHYNGKTNDDAAGPNQRLMIERKGIINRNLNREWGII